MQGDAKENETERIKGRQSCCVCAIYIRCETKTLEKRCAFKMSMSLPFTLNESLLNGSKANCVTFHENKKLLNKSKFFILYFFECFCYKY